MNACIIVFPYTASSNISRAVTAILNFTFYTPNLDYLLNIQHPTLNSTRNNICRHTGTVSLYNIFLLLSQDVRVLKLNLGFLSVNQNCNMRRFQSASLQTKLFESVSILGSFN